jgi:PAS domain-containing protein
VVLIDDMQQIEWWNPAAERLLGIEQMTRGRNILRLYYANRVLWIITIILMRHQMAS